MKLKNFLAVSFLLIAICACSGEANTNRVSKVDTQLGLDENLPLNPSDWPEVNMPSADVLMQRCNDNFVDGIPIKSMSAEALTDVLKKCVPRKHTLPVALIYDGPIEKGTAELFARIDYLVQELDPSSNAQWPLMLGINSGGGDVGEAISVGNILSTREWAVRIMAKDYGSARCHSSCVLIYAAGSDRGNPSSTQLWKAWNKRSLARAGKPHSHIIVNDETNIGIHRLFPALSTATSVDGLYEDTQVAVQLIGDYFAKNGVSRSLAEDMMAVPSNEIRVLTIGEVNRYGLGEVNSAKADLDRLDIIRRCGNHYASRREIYLREMDVCWEMITHEQSSAGPVEQCREAVKLRTSIPDASCPDPRVGK